MAETGQSKLKKVKKIWLSTAVTADVVEFTFQQEEYENLSQTVTEYVASDRHRDREPSGNVLRKGDLSTNFVMSSKMVISWMSMKRNYQRMIFSHFKLKNLLRLLLMFSIVFFRNCRYARSDRSGIFVFKFKFSVLIPIINKKI